MGVARVQEAAYTYHVFLSFRGADTRKNFTDHLYEALVQAGIHTFRDDNEIEKGENIREEIQRAIFNKTKMSLIILSKNYASSTWCLDELVKIMEHRKSFHQHVVLPIFYDVTPSQVKNQTGSFAEAFAKHERHFKSEKEVVQRWRAALIEIAELGGMVLEDRHEAQFLQNIVQEVQNKLHRSSCALYVAPYLVGVDNLVKCINWWLEDGSNKVGMATICGIGGIGKTIIAKVVYNQNIQRFEACSFLADVREACQERSGLVRLQRQLISDILKGKVKKVLNTDDGIVKIKEALYCRKVLLILDDVDDLEKVTKIIGTRIPLYPGSKIVLTSRQRNLLCHPLVTQMFDLEASLSNGGLCKVFEVKELAFNESLQLFNWYAFGQSAPIDNYTECARIVVKHCSGLPLALQVLGSSLFGKGIKVWESALQKLEVIPDNKVQKILRISYDSLQDNHDKNLFLDIACVFVGKDRHYATTILDGCDYYTTIGIENLIDMCLVVVNEKNRLMMHQMVREMGKEIVRQESPELGKRSRLWHKDAFDVLRGKSGTNTIKSLSIDLQGGHLDTIKGLTSNEVSIDTEAFAKMQKLNLLQLDHVKLKGDYRNLPKGLIWLHWHGFSLKSFPRDFDAKRLVVLDMRFSRLKQIWKDTKCLPNLKILNLNHSHELLKTPDFSGLPSLEKLMLKDCIKLTEVDHSIGELKRLTFLNLEGCYSFRRLPRTIGSLESLEELILSGCTKLNDVPKELQDLNSLRVLNLDKTAIHESNSRPCRFLSLKGSKQLGFCWEYLPSSLVKLSLESCGLSDDLMPKDLSGLPSLKCLNLSRNLICWLPESIGCLTNLDELQLAYCTELQSIPKLPPILFNKFLAKTTGSNDTISNLQCLLSFKRCVVFGCEKLTQVQEVFKMESIENFEVDQIKILFTMDSIASSKLQIYNYLTDTIVDTPMVLHEFGITSTFVPGNEVPLSFEHRYNKGYPKISFSVPPHPCEEIMCLKLCIVYSLVADNIMDLLPCLEITNDSKKTSWVYWSSFIGIPNKTKSNTMLWLIHLPVSRRQLEGGDRISCLAYPPLEIREFGIGYGLESSNTYENDLQPFYYTGNENSAGNKLEQQKEGLLNLGCTGNLQIQFGNEDSNMIASLQALYHHTISGFSHSAHAWGPRICFKVPPNSSNKICWIRSAILLLVNDDCKTSSEFSARVEIFNETKQLRWTYYECFMGIQEANMRTYLTWLNFWKFTDELESGDDVSLTVVSDLPVVECGLDLYEPKENGLQNSTAFVFGNFTYLLFISQRNLCRMEGSVKE